MSVEWKAPSDGWIVDKLLWQSAFSDGSVIFVGERKGKTRTLAHKKVKKPFDLALRKCLIKRLRPTEIERRDSLDDGGLPCVVLSGGTWIQEMYYDYAMKFKGVKLYLGKKYTEHDHAVICKVGKKIVGVILPIRAPQK